MFNFQNNISNSTVNSQNCLHLLNDGNSLTLFAFPYFLFFFVFFLPPFSFIKNLCLFCFTVRIHCMRVLFFVFSFCSFKKTQSNWIINQFGINNNKYIIFWDKFLNVNMTIDPNMIEVNEITDYWSFLMSVCSEY